MPRPRFDDIANGLPPLPPELDPRGRRHARKAAARAARGGSGGGSGGSGGGGGSAYGGGGYAGPPARRPRRSRTVLVAMLVCTALSVALLAFAGTYWWKFNQFTSNLNRLDIAAAQGASPADPDGSDQDILVVGNDDRTDMTNAEVHDLHTGRSGGSLNTDTMMVIHIPADGSRATLISLPRDSYVAIPGHGMNKLNSAYPDAYTATHGDLAAKRSAGASLLVRTVQSLTGLHIDHFVQVDLIGFYRISNAIGGVTVNMCAAVKEQNSGIDLHKGINVVKGFQALAFVRQRYNFPNGLGDLDRVKRQQYFLTAAFRKVASAGVLLNPFKLQDLLRAIQRSLYVDKTLDPLALGRELENLTADKIVGQTIPTDGFADTGVGSVVVVHPGQVKAFVTKLVTPSPAPNSTTAAKKKASSSKSPALDSKCIY